MNGLILFFILRNKFRHSHSPENELKEEKSHDKNYLSLLVNSRGVLNSVYRFSSCIVSLLILQTEPIILRLYVIRPAVKNWFHNLFFSFEFPESLSCAILLIYVCYPIFNFCIKDIEYSYPMYFHVIFIRSKCLSNMSCHIGVIYHDNDDDI